ncbi:putative reverse transcriptase/RNA-dependent DNA polymerase [Citrus sinensis]|uniref:Reverse transcriptase/RNA-dependent DNA polymerase n=1 Tax=Citrus sinensis TaxID=2711 RepID=A0ACB8I233_CITSI|nr:putative reverse transcriptase/RNA-dependent DNA polymerase [Citrus sinensis]
MIHGLKFDKQVTVSHLLFADDSLVFTKASIEDCRNLKVIFDSYAAASGQIFNYEKSSMFYSGKLSAEQISAIKNIFQLKMLSKFEKYLGLPSMIGRKKTSFFNEVKLKLLSKISNWQYKFFSSGGKEVLIKAVAQAVPAYAMSVFKIPSTLCEDIQKAMAKFWWGNKKEKHGIHWASCERMSHAKHRGGLGFRDISSFNQALVAKQSWRIIQDSESLMARVLKARYFKHEGFLNAKIECKAARKIRQHSSLAAVEIPSSHGGSMLDVFLDASRLLSKKEAELQIAYWWVTWYARNHFLFKRQKPDPLISTAKVEAVVEAFRRYKKPEHQQMESSKAERAKQWKPPPKNWYKANVDAAIENQRQRVGLGVVVRNDNGDIVAAAIKLSSFNGEVSFTEAEAIECGMQVAGSAGITSVIF